MSGRIGYPDFGKTAIDGCVKTTDKRGEPLPRTWEKDMELVGDIDTLCHRGKESETVVGDDKVEMFGFQVPIEQAMVAEGEAHYFRQGTEHRPDLAVARRIGQAKGSQRQHREIGEMAAEQEQTIAIAPKNDLIAGGKMLANKRNTAGGVSQSPVQRCNEKFHIIMNYEL